jgi:hypothetical protein
MNLNAGLLAAAAALTLAACNATYNPDTIASGGSAGSSGPEYCETVPADPTELQRWNEVCAPER